jgi:hypothetical protein
MEEFTITQDYSAVIGDAFLSLEKDNIKFGGLIHLLKKLIIVLYEMALVALDRPVNIVVKVKVWQGNAEEIPVENHYSAATVRAVIVPAFVKIGYLQHFSDEFWQVGFTVIA